MTKTSYVLERPELGCLAVTGSERIKWLQGLLTCDVSVVSQLQGAWGLLLTKQGKIVTDLNVIDSGQAVYLSTAAGLSESVTEYLLAYLIMEDAELDDVSASMAWLSIHGPEAGQLAQVAAVSGALAVGRIDWTGLGGAAVAVDRARLPALADALVAAGGLSVTRADAELWQQLRVEAGFPEFGVDYTSDDNPHQAAIEQQAVSFTKGCYLGQEVVCMQDMRGKVKRRVVSLVLESGSAPRVGTPVQDAEGHTVGEVTSSVVSPTLSRAIALARVKNPFFEAGTVVKVEGHSGTIVERPLVG